VIRTPYPSARSGSLYRLSHPGFHGYRRVSNVQTCVTCGQPRDHTAPVCDQQINAVWGDQKRLIRKAPPPHRPSQTHYFFHALTGQGTWSSQNLLSCKGVNDFSPQKYFVIFDLSFSIHKSTERQDNMLHCYTEQRNNAATRDFMEQLERCSWYRNDVKFQIPGTCQKSPASNV
jgi:hypothetical protein